MEFHTRIGEKDAKVRVTFFRNRKIKIGQQSRNECIDLCGGQGTTEAAALAHGEWEGGFFHGFGGVGPTIRIERTGIGEHLGFVKHH